MLYTVYDNTVNVDTQNLTCEIDLKVFKLCLCLIVFMSTGLFFIWPIVSALNLSVNYIFKQLLSILVTVSTVHCSFKTSCSVSNCYASFQKEENTCFPVNTSPVRTSPLCPSPPSTTLKVVPTQ